MMRILTFMGFKWFEGFWLEGLKVGSNAFWGFVGEEFVTCTLGSVFLVALSANLRFVQITN